MSALDRIHGMIVAYHALTESKYRNLTVAKSLSCAIASAYTLWRRRDTLVCPISSMA